ncbi:MAG: alpha/beta hydrolase fold domain-containing protein [Clostridia bacterium]|nr:alpha/beta hydrolase fold domain-containing protein [Clostridia bacterium]
MTFSTKFARKQLDRFKPLLTESKLSTARRGQEKLGEIMAMTCQKTLDFFIYHLENFDCVRVAPKDDTRNGIMLYLHGGGYCCGDISYAKGVGAMLASRFGIRVFAPAYRLAPQHPYPAALEDALCAYQYLLTHGYDGDRIVLCGESAGGGLLYSLCALLREKNLPLPCGIVAISPWTDLTASGESYRKNRDKDPSITPERLDFFADLYTKDRKNPLVSPLFADLTEMPPSLIIVGGDEVMLDDSVSLHEKLLASGRESELIVGENLWHSYILYNLKERGDDYAAINKFLKERLPRPRKLRWMRLDNAAKIYPAAQSRNWSNSFRLSATLNETIDTAVMQSALDVTVRRFPSMAVRLCTGVFWYYLEELSEAPALSPEKGHPLEKMSVRDVHRCALKVLVYENRVAVELFHSLTDGNGGLVFLKTLIAEYLEQRYGVSVPAEKGVLDRREEPRESEMEDSFLKYKGDAALSRRDTDAFRIKGVKDPDRFVTDTAFLLPVEEVHREAKKYGVSITAFLTAVLTQAAIELQEKRVPDIRKRKPVKILLPVNLRKMFPSESLRNFVLYMTSEVCPDRGDYSFDEICRIVAFQMGIEVTPKHMRAKFTTNVNSEIIPIIKIMPLFIKNIVMKSVFRAVGERKSTVTFSNLGMASAPDIMKDYVTRFDFILSPQATSPYNCSAISYGDTLYFHFIRNTVEPEYEMQFYRVLRGLGIHAAVESNRASIEPFRKMPASPVNGADRTKK